MTLMGSMNAKKFLPRLRRLPSKLKTVTASKTYADESSSRKGHRARTSAHQPTGGIAPATAHGAETPIAPPVKTCTRTLAAAAMLTLWPHSRYPIFPSGEAGAPLTAALQQSATGVETPRPGTAPPRPCTSL